MDSKVSTYYIWWTGIIILFGFYTLGRSYNNRIIKGLMPPGRTWVSINSTAVAGHGFPKCNHHRRHRPSLPNKPSIPLIFIINYTRLLPSHPLFAKLGGQSFAYNMFACKTFLKFYTSDVIELRETRVNSVN
ncbi:hypothetical protein QTP88_022235 [Uroleucon formosanum]